MKGCDKVRCSNDNITVDFDFENGYTSEIYYPIITKI